MRGLKRDHTAGVVMRGHALMQNLRRGHYELELDARHHQRIATSRQTNSAPTRAIAGALRAAFTQLARTI
jgi:hypothetical protein